MKRLLYLALVPVGIACCALLARQASSPDTMGPTRYDVAIRRAARRHLPPGWDWRILKAMVYQESRFDANAVSAAGAIGLCQLLPSAAAALGVHGDALRRPKANLDTGARYLRQCWDAVDGMDDQPPRWDRSRAAIAAYHAGPGALRRAQAACGPAGGSWRALAGQLPMATRQHVDAVFEHAYREARRVHPGGGTGVGPAAGRRERGRAVSRSQAPPIGKPVLQGSAIEAAGRSPPRRTAVTAIRRGGRASPATDRRLLGGRACCTDLDTAMRTWRRGLSNGRRPV